MRHTFGMGDGEVLGRIDRSLERIDEHMARGNELMDDVREEMRLSRAQYRELSERHESLIRDMRQFMHEAIVRMERITTRMTERMDDLHEESVAQRRALLWILDRLGGNGPSGASSAA
jgi:methyl-accepting chemotaxis protein